MIKNAFHLMLRALFILEIFTILSWLFGYAGKRLDKKAIVNYKIYEVADWAGNSFHKHIALYLKN